jgi:alpha-glucoside transport system substrate-binding protein
MSDIRRHWKILFVAIAATLVVACSSGTSDSDKTATAAAGGGGSEGTPAATAPAETPPAESTAGAGGDQGTVSVLGLWGSTELDAFNKMVAGWPGTVDFTGTRSITSILTTRVEGGSPPDVAIPAEVGLFQQFAKEGKLKPLSDCPGLEEKVKADYPQAYIDLGTVDGTLYGFFMKADSKATIFYNPKYFSANNLTPLTADSTFDDLISLADQIKATGIPPFSIGEEAGDGSGFPGSDVIQQIVLNEDGADFYDAVIAGTSKFTDPMMKAAWEEFGKMALTDGYTSQGGAAGINATNFQDSAYPPFTDPPTAGMVPLGSFTAGFITSQFPNAVAGDDYNFMPWPGGGVTGSANIAYAFNSNPATCSFLTYLESAEAQDIWVKIGGFTSLNKNVSLSDYPDPVTKALANQLLNAKTFRFDLDDAIGGALQQAEFAGVTQYLSDPGSLDSILSNIEAARK